MHRTLRWAAWILLGVQPGFLSAATIDEVVAQVSQATYTSNHELLYVHDGANRGIDGAEHDLARTNIYNYLGGLGLTTSLDPFIYNSQTYYNVVAVKPGKTTPSEIYIVGAHYDSVNNPGADDNASGVAGVMELARALAPYEFEATLMFMAFDREEQGLWGSRAYASTHAADNILGMISLDMIAYNDPDPSRHDTAAVYGRATSDPLKLSLADAITAYGNGIKPTVLGQFDASDHAPFEWNGKQAALLIEGAIVPPDYANPYYHQAADSVDTPNYIDYVYATNMTRSVAGYLAGSAILVPEPATLIMLGMMACWLLARRRTCR